jgi:hypothetical protein
VKRTAQDMEPSRNLEMDRTEAASTSPFMTDESISSSAVSPAMTEDFSDL